MFFDSFLEEAQLFYISKMADLSQFSIFLLICSTMISCWVAPRWVSCVGTCLSSIMAYWFGYVDILGLSVLVGMAVLLWNYHTVSGLPKMILGLIVIGITLCIYLHFMPGFYNFIIEDQLKISPSSEPYTVYANVDKALASLILLLYFRDISQSFKDWVASFQAVPIPLFTVCVLLIGSAYAMDYVRFEPKLPSVLWRWIPFNLLFACVTEEVFYRGFIQRELSRALGERLHGQWLSVGVAAVIFGVAHYSGGIAYVGLATLAGVVYGIVYLKSNRLEAAISIHFLVNLIHILFFSYPSLSH